MYQSPSLFARFRRLNGRLYSMTHPGSHRDKTLFLVPFKSWNVASLGSNLKAPDTRNKGFCLTCPSVKGARERSKKMLADRREKSENSRLIKGGSTIDGSRKAGVPYANISSCNPDIACAPSMHKGPNV